MKLPRISSKPSRACSSGFTLVELLTVVAIISALSLLGILGFNSIASSKGVTTAATSLSALFEYSRSEAISRQTHVWVAMLTLSENNATYLVSQAFYSADGTSAMTVDNLRPLTNKQRVRSVAMVLFADLDLDTISASDVSAPSELAGNPDGVPELNLPNDLAGSSTVTFTPRGEALLSASPGADKGFTPEIVLGIVSDPIRGDARDDAALIIDGGTGQSRTTRL